MMDIQQYACTHVCSVMCDSATPWTTVPRGILQARVLEWVPISLLQGMFLAQRLNLHLVSLLNWQADSIPLGNHTCHYTCIEAQ